MRFRRDRSGKHTDKEWHRNRHLARHHTFNLDDWSDEEIVRYDLDTADITGRLNPRSYTFDRDIDILKANGTDIRELKDR